MVYKKLSALDMLGLLGALVLIGVPLLRMVHNAALEAWSG